MPLDRGEVSFAFRKDGEKDGNCDMTDSLLGCDGLGPPHKAEEVQLVLGCQCWRFGERQPCAAREYPCVEVPTLHLRVLHLHVQQVPTISALVVHLHIRHHGRSNAPIFATDKTPATGRSVQGSLETPLLLSHSCSGLWLHELFADLDVLRISTSSLRSRT